MEHLDLVMFWPEDIEKYESLVDDLKKTSPLHMPIGKGMIGIVDKSRKLVGVDGVIVFPCSPTMIMLDEELPVFYSKSLHVVGKATEGMVNLFRTKAHEMSRGSFFVF